MVIISYFVASPKFLAEFDCTCFSPKVPMKENGTLDVVQPRLEVGIERKLSMERSVPTFCFLALFYLLDTLPCNCILNKLKLYEKFFLIRGRFLVLKRVSVVLGSVGRWGGGWGEGGNFAIKKWCQHRRIRKWEARLKKKTHLINILLKCTTCLLAFRIKMWKL